MMPRSKTMSNCVFWMHIYAWYDTKSRQLPASVNGRTSVQSLLHDRAVLPSQSTAWIFRDGLPGPAHSAYTAATHTKLKSVYP